MSKIIFRSILNFYWNSKTIYSAHSPFVYDFIRKILNKKVDSKKQLFDSIEIKRKGLIQSKDSIPFVEYGAGSNLGSNGSKRRVSDIAKNSLSGEWQCRIMSDLISEYKLNSILEIGTSLGVSTAYLAAGNPNAKIVTLEGNPSSASIAKNLFKELNFERIDVKVGEFGSTLQPAIEEFETIDFAFLDGNHRKQATIDYFKLLKEKASPRSMFVVDDIYWSKGMNEAWKEIMKDETVAYTIDLFRMGIVFFDHTKMEKQHFKVIPYKYKPWSIGVFG